MTELELLDYARGIHKLDMDELHKTVYPLITQKDFFGKTYMCDVAQKIKNDNKKDEQLKFQADVRDKVDM